ALANEASLDDPVRASALLPMVIAAVDEEDPGVRLEVLRCLNALIVPIKGTGGPAAALPNRQADLTAIVATLTRELHHSDHAVPSEALNGLWALGPFTVPAVPDLLEALHDASPSIREGAVKTLSQITTNEKVALPAIIAMLDDADPTVRIAVVRALGQSK